MKLNVCGIGGATCNLAARLIRFQSTARIAARKGRLALFLLSRQMYVLPPTLRTIWNSGCTSASVIRLDSLSSYYYRIIHPIMVSDPLSYAYYVADSVP